MKSEQTLKKKKEKDAELKVRSHARPRRGQAEE